MTGASLASAAVSSSTRRGGHDPGRLNKQSAGREVLRYSTSVLWEVAGASVPDLFTSTASPRYLVPSTGREVLVLGTVIDRDDISRYTFYLFIDVISFRSRDEAVRYTLLLLLHDHIIPTGISLYAAGQD